MRTIPCMPSRVKTQTVHALHCSPSGVDCSSLLLRNLILLSILARKLSLPRHLLLRLLIAVHDELVQETTRLSMVISLFFRFGDIAVEMSRGFLIDLLGVLVFVDICYVCQRAASSLCFESVYGSCRAKTTSS